MMHIIICVNFKKDLRYFGGFNETI